MKHACLCVLMLLVALAIVILSIRLFTPEDTWVCADGQWIPRGFPIKGKPSMPCP